MIADVSHPIIRVYVAYAKYVESVDTQPDITQSLTNATINVVVFILEESVRTAKVYTTIR